MIQDSHTFLAFGMFSTLVLSALAVAIGACNSFSIHQMRDQIEQAADAATPSMADVLDDDGPGEDSYRAAPLAHAGNRVVSEPADISEPEPPKAKTEEREFGGRVFQFAVESPRADESPREAEAVQGVRGGGPVRRPSPTPRRQVPRAAVPDAPQRPEA